MHDHLGRALKKGDQVAFATRVRDKGILRVGTVEAFVPNSRGGLVVQVMTDRGRLIERRDGELALLP